MTTKKTELKQLFNDLEKIKVDGENCDQIGELSFTKKGIPYILADKGGDWENPVIFCVYYDGKHIRGYIPTYGNCFDRFNKTAFGNSDDDDAKTLKKLFKNKYYSGIQSKICYNKDACIKDIEQHITLTKK